MLSVEYVEGSESHGQPSLTILNLILDCTQA